MIDVIVAGRRAASSMDHVGVDAVIGIDFASLDPEAYNPEREKGFAELMKEMLTHLFHGGTA